MWFSLLYTLIIGIFFGMMYYNMLLSLLIFVIFELLIYIEINRYVINKDKYIKTRTIEFIVFLVGLMIGRQFYGMGYTGVRQRYLVDCRI